MSNTNTFIIEGGTVIDPLQGINQQKDIFVEDGKVKGLENPGSFSSIDKSVKRYDAAGQFVAPGLVNIHAHLREPGQEWKEDIRSGSQAAVAGGFTTVCCMPNTEPAIDNAQVVEYIKSKAAAVNLCEILPIGAITKGRKGKELAGMLELHGAGCVAFSDDGGPVSHAGIMRRALEYSKIFNGVLTVHEEVVELSEGYVMNESETSVRLGLKGMPGAAEDIMIARDIELARLTGGRVHFCHVSTARAVTLIKRAKEDGINVTAEATPHNFTLDDSYLATYDANYKMGMPLRSKADVEGILEGIQSGVIDAIADDHAPHEDDTKRKEIDIASFGILGFQSTLPLVLNKVAEGRFSLMRAIEALTVSPARCFNLELPTLKVGHKANIVIFDTKLEYDFSRNFIRSKSKNTPFLNNKFKGGVINTFYQGREVFSMANHLESIKSV